MSFRSLSKCLNVDPIVPLLTCFHTSMHLSTKIILKHVFFCFLVHKHHAIDYEMFIFISIIMYSQLKLLIKKYLNEISYGNNELMIFRDEWSCHMHAMSTCRSIMLYAYFYDLNLSCVWWYVLNIWLLWIWCLFNYWWILLLWSHVKMIHFRVHFVKNNNSSRLRGLRKISLQKIFVENKNTNIFK